MFELCEAGGNICQKPPEGQAEACQAGCVMAKCPKQVACTEHDPIWCKPCDDEEGALFWRNVYEADRTCNPMPGVSPSEWSLAMINAYGDCYIAEGERRCPALTGTKWYLPPHARE